MNLVLRTLLLTLLTSISSASVQLVGLRDDDTLGAQGIFAVYFYPPKDWQSPTTIVYDSDQQTTRNLTFWEYSGPNRTYEAAQYTEVPTSTSMEFLLMDSRTGTLGQIEAPGPGVYLLNATGTTIESSSSQLVLAKIKGANGGCPGYPDTAPNMPCFGFGNCTDYNECICNSNYTGAACNMCTACTFIENRNISAHRPLTHADYFKIPGVSTHTECCAYAVGRGADNWAMSTWHSQNSECVVYTATDLKFTYTNAHGMFIVAVPGTPGVPTPPPTTLTPAPTVPTDTPSPTPTGTDAPAPTTPPEHGLESDMQYIWIGVAFAVILILGVIWARSTRRHGPADAEVLDDAPDGHYNIIRPLGHGAFGTVYLAHSPNFEENVAVKVITCADDNEMQHAWQEFDALRSLQGHPNLVPLLDMFLSWESPIVGAPVREDVRSDSSQHEYQSTNHSGIKPETVTSIGGGRYLCLVMPYFEHGTLHRYLQGVSFLAPSIVKSFTCQMAEVLEYMHARNIIHRDLKPANILVAREGNGSDEETRVVVSDFGLAKLIENTTLEATTTRGGTLAYLAPEQVHNVCGSKADMWGLGCLMYAMMTLRVGRSSERILFMDRLNTSAEEFEQGVREECELAGHTGALVDIMLKLLTVDSAERPSATEVLQELWQHGEYE
eukprot:PhM_4_TR1761/c0_g1_i2/m.38262/K17539/PDIK1L, CLIK1L; serine/threonine-protein kinase PDIK1L